VIARAAGTLSRRLHTLRERWNRLRSCRANARSRPCLVTRATALGESLFADSRVSISISPPRERLRAIARKFFSPVEKRRGASSRVRAERKKLSAQHAGALP
jgi:hypothetical protein